MIKIIKWMGGRKSIGFFLIFVAANVLVSLRLIEPGTWLAAILGSFAVFSGSNILSQYIK